jgi:hypothetical protein
MFAQNLYHSVFDENISIRHTSIILCYFFLDKSPAFRNLASLASSVTVMQQQTELVLVLRPINFMTPHVISFSQDKRSIFYEDI